MNISGYLTPEEAAQASTDETDKALGAVISMLLSLLHEKRNLRLSLEHEYDDEVVGEIEYKMKLIRSEEASLHRIESGLQSRLKVQ